MEGFRTPPKLMDDRMGHIDGSVQARYTHITREMREELMVNLTTEWEVALDARLAICPTSPVSVLNGLLQERLRAHR
jgi:ABC-type phosphonate transport system ATPase subunit